MSLVRLLFKIGLLSVVYSTSYSQHNINELLRNSVRATPYLYSLYEMDVKHFYGLEDRNEFSSELKAKIFRQSNEYKSMYVSMLRQKNDIFNHTYHIKIGYDVGNYLLKHRAFAMNIRHLHYYTPGDLASINYPLQKGILFFDDGLLQKANSNVIYVREGVAIAINPLNIKLDANKDRFLFLATDEKTALKIEESKKNLYIFFNPVEYKIHRYKYTQSFMVWSEKKDDTHRSFVSDGIRIVLADDETGEIYYDKTYSTSTQSGSNFLMKRGTVRIRLKDNDSSEDEAVMLHVNPADVANETENSNQNQEQKVMSKEVEDRDVERTNLAEDSSLVAQKRNDEIYTVVKQEPEFPGGMAALGQYLQKNLRYPATAQRASISGRVFVGFIVNEDGSLSDYKVLKGLGSGTDEEALRVIKEMPRWKPGKVSGRPVKCNYSLPINFTLE